MDDQPRRIGRRTVLRGGAAVTLAVFAPLGGGPSAMAIGVPGEGADRPRVLSDDQLAVLRALVDRIVPGKPEDPAAEGAVAAHCAEAIEALLGAFEVDPPLIYAGAPFSDRGGHEVNEFTEFLPLDAYEERAWRLRIEGSRGRPELEFNGPVTGYRATYTDGLAALDSAAGPTGFAALPGPGRDAVLHTSDDPAIIALLDIAVPHTFEFLYGAPEYGGNTDLLGWKFTGFDGDVQPRGYTDEQVREWDGPQPPVPLPDLPGGLTAADLHAVLPLASPEVMFGVIERTGGTLSGMRTEVKSIVDAARKGFGHA